MATKETSSNNGGGGAWGSKKGPPSSVLQAAAHGAGGDAPPRNTGSNTTTNNSNNNNNRNQKDKDNRRNSNKKQNSNNNTGGGKTNSKNNSYNKKGGSDKNAQAGTTPRLPSKNLQEIETLNTTGAGTTPQQKKVTRVSAAKFLKCRLQYLDAPTGATWTPHERCHWTDKGRVDIIQTEQERLWNYKPLQVNDETRWKAKVMLDDTVEQTQQERDAEQLRQAVAILNKISWTTLHKLTVQFLESIGAVSTADTPAVLSKQVVQQCMTLIVDKAMGEPHFAELYARFSAKLAVVHKTFKKTLLSLCQTAFEETDQEVEFADGTSEAERNYALKQSKQKSIGLMQFIGELYKNKLIKGGIMIGCLQRLLVNDDEEKLECFAKLMTTIGERLHDNEDEPEMIALWAQVYSLAGKSKKAGGPEAPSSRIKFLLTDLIELKQNGWVTRRVVEKAKSIAQIHKEVAAEEKMGRQPYPPKIKRSQSGSAVKSTPAPPPADNDGFVQVSKPRKQPMQRAQSDIVSAVPTSSLQRAMMGLSTKASEPSPSSPAEAPPISEYMEPQECGKKMKSVLKEYFVGGDTDDAVLSVDEFVGAGHEGHVERGAAMIAAGVQLVIEMKEEQVRKFLIVTSRCLKEEKINKSSLPSGLNDPLEFLRDVEIDAPLASSLLAIVVAEWIQLDVLSLDFLQSCPEYFRADGRPADFAVQIIAKRGGAVTDADVEIVTSLMSDTDKEAHPSVKEWLEAGAK